MAKQEKNARSAKRRSTGKRTSLTRSDKKAKTAASRPADSSVPDPTGYFLFDSKGLIKEVNLAGAEMLGMTKRLLLNKPVLTFIEPAHRTIVREHLREAFNARTNLNCEITLEKKDGAQFNTRWNSLFIAGKDGEPDLCRTAVSYVTEHKLTERVIERLASFPRLNPNPVLELDAGGKVLYYNEATTAILKRLDLRDDPDLFLPADLQEMLPLLKQGSAQQIRYREVEIGGRIFAEDIYLMPDLGVVRIYAFDISERKKAEKALQQKTIHLNVRVKELNCLYGMSRLTIEPDIALDEVFEKAVHLLPPAWCYPEVTCARISFEGQTFTTRNYRETPWKQSADIVVSEKKLGSIDVFLLEEKNVIDGQPFLNEERDLIEYIARKLGTMVERKRAEQALRESEERHRVVLQTATDGFWLVDSQGRIREVNEAYCRMSGYNEQELLGMSISDLEVTESEYETATHIQKVMTKGEDRFETWHRRKDGRVYDVEVSVQYRPVEGGRFVGFLRDITERKRIEETHEFLSQYGHHHEDQDFFGSLARYLSGCLDMDFVCIDRLLGDGLNARTVAVFHNGEFEDNVAYALKDTPCGDVVGKTICCFPREVSRLFPMDAVLQELMAESYAGVTLWSFDGRPIGLIAVIGRKPLEKRGLAEAVLKLVAGRAAGELERLDAEQALLRANDELEARVQDRTRDLQRAVESLKERERRDTIVNALLKQFTNKYGRKDYLDSAVELIRDWTGCRHVGLRITGRDGNIPYESCLGFTPEFLETENMLSIKDHHCACTRVITGRPEQQDLPAMTNAGSFYLNNSSQFMETLTEHQRSRFRGVCIKSGFSSIAVIPVRHQESVLGAIHLADEREGMLSLKNVEFIEKLAFIIGEAMLRFNIEEERARLASAVQSTAEAVVVTNQRGMIQYVNPAFERTTGYSRDEIVGRDMHILDSGKHDAEFYRKVRDTLDRDGVWSGQFMNTKKDGSLYYEECTMSPVRGSSGEIINYVSVRRDVTEKLRLESIAESVNTMDNIGFVFSGVRHEIGNPINSINAILTVLRSKLDTLSTENVRNHLDRTIEQISRVEYILRSLKSFNLYETQELQNVSVKEFFDGFLHLVKEDFAKKGNALETELDAGVGWAYTDPRALQQVLLNIVSNAADAVAGRARPKVTLRVHQSDGLVRIRVQDNGCGIPEEKLNDIFKPFYTTKQHGTGLGLVIVKKMLVRMQGTIEIKSRKDEGTTVDISIPTGKPDEN